MDDSPAILIIDDNHQLLNLMEVSLTSLTDYRVFTASDGAAGLAQFFVVQPACVVIDVKMPQLDGYQLVRALRGDPASAQMPLILLTALAQDKDEFVGLASGADQYLRKPIKPLDLIAAIDRALHIDPASRAQHMQALLDKPIPKDS